MTSLAPAPDDNFKALAIKATLILKAAGVLTLVAISLIAPQGGIQTGHIALICAAMALLLPAPAAILKPNNPNTAFIVLAIDLVIALVCYSQLASGQIAQPYLYILPLTLLQTSLYQGATRQLLSLLLVLLAVTTTQYILLSPALIGTTASSARTIVEFIDSSDWPNFVSALMAFAFVGYSLNFASTTTSTGTGRVPPPTVAALMLVGWSILMIVINNLANTVKYKGELVVESNMHHVSLIIAVLLLMSIGRVKRPITTVLVLAIAAFFMTVAASYSFYNGFELLYFLALATITLKSQGLKSKIGVALFLLSALLAVQINAHAIFVDATTSGHPLLLMTYTWPQVAGVVSAFLLVALLTQSKRKSATP